MVDAAGDAAKDLRERGNVAFRAGNLENAIQLYTAGLGADPSSDHLLLCNRAAAQLKLSKFEEALESATSSISLKSDWSKAYFRQGEALIGLNRQEEALAAFKKAQQFDEADKSSAAITKRIQRLSSKSIIGSEKKPDARDFEEESRLGDGNFSRVVKARHKPSGEVFALKIIDKKEIERLKRRHPNVTNEVQMEKQALNKLSHPNIVKLHHTFQDQASLFYLMDFTPNGEVWSKLMYRGKQTGCNLTMARFYAAELVNAFEYMHGKGIVHRDIKPENFIIDGKGHLQLIDFGTAKDLVDTSLNGPEFVGTAEYMSPEVVGGKKFAPEGAGPEADLWGLGCSLFQFQAGESPFKAGSQYLSFLKIQRGTFLVPLHMDTQLADLIRKLVVVTPKDRLGSSNADGNIAEGYKKLKAHPFFSTIDFVNIHLQCPPEPTTEELKWAELRDKVFHPDYDCTSEEDTAELQQMMVDHGAAACEHAKHYLIHVLHRQQVLGPPFGYEMLKQVYAGPRQAFQGRFQCQWMHENVMLPYNLNPIWKNAMFFVVLTAPCLGQGCTDQSGSVQPDEIRQLKRALLHANGLMPKLVVLIGPLTAASPGQAGYEQQVYALQEVLLVLSSQIPLLIVPSRYDVKDCSNTSPDVGLEAFHQNFGASYYGFWAHGVRGLVLNDEGLTETDYGIEGDTQPATHAMAQEVWLDRQLEECNMCAHHTIVFTHRPWFHDTLDEDGGEGVAHTASNEKPTAIPKKTRMRLLSKFRDSKVKALFAAGPAVSARKRRFVAAEGSFPVSNDEGDQVEIPPPKGRGMELIDTAPVSHVLGAKRVADDKTQAESAKQTAPFQPGFSIVKLLDEKITHRYYSLQDMPDEVELEE